MHNLRKGGRGIPFLLIFIFNLNAQIKKFNASFKAERYYIKGNFENSLTKPFYKDYENCINLFLNGYIYHYNFVNYEFKTYFVWQGWNKNLRGIEEKNFLKTPYSLNIRIFPKTRFPFRFFVKREDFRKEKNTTYSIKTLTYIVSQSLILPKLPSINFSYRFRTENKVKRNAYSFKINYMLFKNHSLFLLYRRELPSVFPSSQNLRFQYNYQIPGKLRVNYYLNNFTRNNYYLLHSNLNFEKFRKRNYLLSFYHFMSKTKYLTSNSLTLKYKKYFSERVISNSGLYFVYKKSETEKNFKEEISQNFSFKFLSFPKVLIISPGVSIMFNQLKKGNGWAYSLRESNMFEHKKLLFFKNFRVFFNFYYAGFNDRWLFNQKIRVGYNFGNSISYESPKYYISFNFYFTKNITKANFYKNEWIKYHTRIEFKTKEIPFYLSYVNEYIRTEYGGKIRKEFIRILFRAPLRIFNLFTLTEKFHFRDKFENNLKITFSKNYGGLILNISLEYIYLIYPGSEHNFIMYFMVKRNLKII